jgi:hypothetical protein
MSLNNNEIPLVKMFPHKEVQSGTARARNKKNFIVFIVNCRQQIQALQGASGIL